MANANYELTRTLGTTHLLCDRLTEAVGSQRVRALSACLGITAQGVGHQQVETPRVSESDALDP
eukprot:3354920-Alexandrium_andersonii.AAC.1